MLWEGCFSAPSRSHNLPSALPEKEHYGSHEQIEVSFGRNRGASVGACEAKGAGAPALAGVYKNTVISTSYRGVQDSLGGAHAGHNSALRARHGYAKQKPVVFSPLEAG